MRRLAVVIVGMAMVLSAAYSGGGVEAQDGAEATINAQETKIVDLKATSEARGERINAQRTRIAELEALLPVVNEDPAIGDVFAIRNIEFTLQGTDLQDSIGDAFFSEDANGVYLLTFLDVVNVSDEPRAFPYDDFEVEDGRGRTYSYDFNGLNAYSSIVAEVPIFEELQPGVSYSIAVVFDVPADATGFTLSSTSRDGFEAPLNR